MLRKAGGSTVGQEGWGGAFNATDNEADDNSLLLDSITRYAERAMAAEGEVSTMKFQMGKLQEQVAAMMMGGPSLFGSPPPHTYQPHGPPPNAPMLSFAQQQPQAAMFGQQTVPPTINISQQQ